MATIGEQLKKAREDHNMSLEELQKKTKIQKKYLEALEEDNFSAMPSSYYVRAFIRQYAKAVDIDGDHLVKVYDGEPSKGSITSQDQTVHETRSEIHTEQSNIVKLQHKLPMIILLIVAFGIIGVVIYETVQHNKVTPIDKRQFDVEEGYETSEDEITLDEEEIDTSDEEIEVKETTPSSEENEDISNNKITQKKIDETQFDVTYQGKTPVELSFTGVSDDCWIGISDSNGFYLFQGTIKPGQTKQVMIPEDVTQAYLTLGMPQAVDIKMNNEPLSLDISKDDLTQKTIILNIESE